MVKKQSTERRESMIWITLSCIMVAITVGGLFYIIEQNNKVQKGE